MPTSNPSGEVTVRRSSAGQSVASSSGSRHHGSSSKVDRSEHGSKRPLALPAIEEDAVSTYRGDDTGYHSRALVRRSSSNRGNSSTSGLSNQLESLTLKGFSSHRSGKAPSSYKQSSSHRSSHHKESSSHHSSKASSSHHREDQALQRTSTAIAQSSQSMNGRSTRDGCSTHRDRSTRDDSHTRDDYHSRHASTRNEPSTRRYASTYRGDSPTRSFHVRSSSNSDSDLDLDIYGGLSTDYATLLQKLHRSGADWLALYNKIDTDIEYAYNNMDSVVDRQVSEIESRLTDYSRVYRAALHDARYSLTQDTSWFDGMLEGLSTKDVKRYAARWAEHLDVPKPRDYMGVRLYAGCWACHLMAKFHRAGAIRGSSSSSRY